MSLGTKSFIFNKHSAWKKSNYSYSTKISDNSLAFLPNIGNSSVFFSKPLDSNNSGIVWGTLKILYNNFENSKFILRIFASDSKEVVVYTDADGKLEKVNIDKFLRSNSNYNVKLEFFNKIGAAKFENPKLVPLFNLKGRYLWFCIECINHLSGQIPKINELEISFPYTNFLEYFPEIYQSCNPSSFMSRFIYIFQSIYMDTEDIIDNIPENFEASQANKDFLDWICSWFSINNILWTDKKLRNLIPDMLDIFNSRGTKKSIFDILKRYIGYEPLIIEKFKITNNEFYSMSSDLIDSLFGENNYFFTVMIPEKATKTKDSYANILKIVKNMAPIDAICNLVVLTNNIILGYHCYLGLNSCISNGFIQKSSDVHKKNSIMVVG